MKLSEEDDRRDEETSKTRLNVAVRASVLMLSLALVGLAGCGGSTEVVTCGQGTSLQDGTCQIESDACGENTVLEDGICTPADTVCGEGTSLDQATGACLSNSQITCGESTTEQDGECVPTIDLQDACQDGLVWDADAERCKLAAENCGEGTQLATNGKCVKSDEICGTNTVFDPDAGSCVTTDSVCAGDTVFNEDIGGCVSGNIITSDCQSPQVLDTDITVDTTLPAGNCYEVATEIAITDDATLTISEGVRIGFQDDAGLTVSGAGASLSAVGTADDPVTFTGGKENRGHWSGITFESSSTNNELTHTIVEYAGQSGSGAVFVGENATASIENSTIRSNAGFGFELQESCCGRSDVIMNTGKLTAFSSNTITNNGSGVARLPIWRTGVFDEASSYTGNDNDRIVVTASASLGRSIIWKDLGIDYEVADSVRISGDDQLNGSLTIEPNVTVRFGAGNGLTAWSGAGLNLEGTNAKPILLTGTSSSQGHWKGLEFQFTKSGDNKLLYTTVEYAGDSQSAGLFVGEHSEVTVQNSTFQNNSGFGIEAEMSCCGQSTTVNNTGKLRSFENNTVTSNSEGAVKLPSWSVDQLDTSSTYTPNAKDQIVISKSGYNYNTIIDTATWRDLGVPYVVDHVISIQGGSWNGFLEIKPGVTVQFKQSAGLNVYNGAALLAEGTSSESITLTGTQQIPGWWKGVHIRNSNNVLNRFTHVTFAYGGQSAWPDTDNGANLSLYEPDGTGYYNPRSASDATTVALDNVTFENSANAGVYVLDDNMTNPDYPLESIDISSCANVTFSGNAINVDSAEQDDLDAFTSACGL